MTDLSLCWINQCVLWSMICVPQRHLKSTYLAFLVCWFRIVNQTDRLVWVFASQRCSTLSLSYIHAQIHSQQHKYWWYQSLISSKNLRAIIFLLRLPWKTPLITLLPMDSSQFRCPWSLLPNWKSICSSEEHSTGYQLQVWCWHCPLKWDVKTLPALALNPCWLGVARPALVVTVGSGKSPGRVEVGVYEIWNVSAICLSFIFFSKRRKISVEMITFWSLSVSSKGTDLPAFVLCLCSSSVSQVGRTQGSILVLLLNDSPPPQL